MLPNSSRAAWVTAETGFHCANVRSSEGRFSPMSRPVKRGVHREERREEERREEKEAQVK